MPRIPTILFLGAALAWSLPESARAACTSKNALHPEHCYGYVTASCANGTYTYFVHMKPGYKCAALMVYCGARQTVAGSGSLTQPAGWNEIGRAHV